MSDPWLAVPTSVQNNRALAAADLRSRRRLAESRSRRRKDVVAAAFDTVAAVRYRAPDREAIKKECDQLKRADERDAFLAAHTSDPACDVPFGISVEFQP